MKTKLAETPAGSPAPRIAATHSSEATDPFSDLYRETGRHEQRRWAELWADAEAQWLTTGGRRTENTRRAYREALGQFNRYLIEEGVDCLWHVTGTHVSRWVAQMENKGASKRTIAARLAACSSYYRFVIQTTVRWAGRETSLFVDARGVTRSNPFEDKLVHRPAVKPFGDAKPVPADAFRWIIDHLRREAGPMGSVETKRNLALMLTFGLSGRRIDEVISMTWGKIREGRTPGAYTYAWPGHTPDGEPQVQVLPTIIYDAIVAYLKTDARWRPGRKGRIQDGDFIWRPIRTAGCANFSNVTTLAENRHISPSSANSVLRRLLIRYYKDVAFDQGLYGIDGREWAHTQAAKYTIHGLRHLFASELYKGSGYNVDLVKERLGHKSTSTTELLLRNAQEPVEDVGDLLARQYGLNTR